MATPICAIGAEISPLRLTTDQIINPEKALTELYPQFTLHNMREMLWEVFSRSLVVNDNELGAFSRVDLLRYYTFVVQIVEAGLLVANSYKRAVETRNDFIHHR
jgi:hypothetical protein